MVISFPELNLSVILNLRVYKAVFFHKQYWRGWYRPRLLRTKEGPEEKQSSINSKHNHQRFIWDFHVFS